MTSFFTLSMVGPHLPAIATAITGLVCAWTWRQKHPMASMLAAISMVITLLAAVGRIWLTFWLFNRTENVPPDQLPNVTIFFGALAALELVAFVVLLIAVFVDRPEKGST